MKYALVFLVLVLATAAGFSTTREECYSEVGAKVAQLHAQNAAQNPAGSITVSTYGCSGTCAYNYQQCEKNAEDGPYNSCVAAANVGGMTAAKGDACIQQLYSLYLQCGDQEIDCCQGEARKSCDAQYYPADATTTDRPEDAQARNDCAEQLGPYGEYSYNSGCYCPLEYTFYNEITRKCVLSTVLAYCEERNAAYDKATDSCICYEGYEPYGGTCVEAGSGAGGGSLGSGASGAAGGGYSSGGGNSAGTCFIVAPFALLALAVLAGKRI